MTRNNILKMAIEKAEANGWKPLMVGYENGYFKDDEHHWPTLWEAKREPYVSFRYESLIYNHDFAKALWPETEVSKVTRSDMFTDIGDHIVQPAWQYHLQQMVIADDPIEYLGENL